MLQIGRHQPWQSYIETQFNVQRRMADWDFTQARTCDDLLAAQDRWVVNFNYQVYWAHRDRQDGRHSPAEVLGWVHGRQLAPAELHRIFCETRSGRTLNRAGCARFRHWCVYGERGLASEAVEIRLYGEHLTVAFVDEAFALYAVTFQSDQRQLAAVTEAHLIRIPYQSPQLPSWERCTGEWLTVIRVAPYVPRRTRQTSSAWQRPPLEAFG